MPTHFSVRPMTEHDARTITAWHYEPPYSFYNPDPESLDDSLVEMMDGSYYAVAGADGQLAGFVAFGATAQVPGGHTHGAYGADALDIGLGMRPDLTGRGLGLSFLQTCIAFAHERFSPPMLRLSVATFNQRAITVYQRAGFKPGLVVPGPAPTRDIEFLVMVLPLGLHTSNEQALGISPAQQGTVL